MSAQVITGVSGRPSPSSPISECMADEHDSAATRAPPSRAAAMASRAARRAPAATSAGSWTANPGSGSDSS